MNNSEDVLTRHLLKLSEIENQFQQLTNRFEEINFKLDKLSNRLSKVQADNQIRFQDIENAMSSSENGNQKISKKTLMKIMFAWLIRTTRFRSISYKDAETNEEHKKFNQLIQLLQ